MYLDAKEKEEKAKAKKQKPNADAVQKLETVESKDEIAKAVNYVIQAIPD